MTRIKYTPALKILVCRGPMYFEPVRKIMHRVAHRLGYDLSLVELNMCPVCGRGFNNFMGLSAHLHRGPCAAQLEAIKDRAVETYYRYRNMMRRTTDYQGGQRYTCYIVELSVDGRKELIKAKTVAEAIELLMGVIPP